MKSRARDGQWKFEVITVYTENENLTRISEENEERRKIKARGVNTTADQIESGAHIRILFEGGGGGDISRPPAS